MTLQCGIVGLPNVGKSTLFNSLLKQNIAVAANYPFATIEPNIGKVPLQDARLQILAHISKSKSVIPNMVDFVDIAGLVQGASKGEGLGNQFLGHIRETQAICHIVRCFDDKNILHVRESINPVQDIEIILTEFRLADLENIEKRIEKLERKAKSGDKESKHQVQLLKFGKSLIESDKPIIRKDYLDITEQDWNFLNLLSSIPMLYVLNVDEQSIEGNHHTKACIEYLNTYHQDYFIMPVALGVQMMSLSSQEKQEYLDLLGLHQDPSQSFIHHVFTMLNQITYFTSGEKESRAWNITEGTLCDDAAGVIHTDFKRGFIAAEVVGYKDFIEGYEEKDPTKAHGGWVDAKTKGKVHLEGKHYIVQDGDVMLFRFNV